MLETTLTTEFVPGTNRSDDLACADWRFLLPSFQLDHVLCLGVPAISTLAVLSTIGQCIFVVSTDYQQLRELHTASRHLGITNLQPVFVDKFANLPFSHGSMSLILVIGQKGTAEIVRDLSIISECGRVLKSEGTMYFETKSLADCFFGHRALRSFGNHGLGSPQVFWLTPLIGGMRTALPLRDGEIARYFFTNVMYGQSFKKRTLSRVGRLLSRLGVLSHITTPRRAVLIRRSQTHALSQPPQYLLSLAEEAGVKLSGHRWGLSTRGRNNSNKVIFYLFGESGNTAECIIKMTRSASFNRRLENEYRVLSLLTEKRPVDRTTFPEPLFFGYHNGLAALGQKAISGQPFRRRTEATARCPYARAAVDWIIELGAASADKTAATTSLVVAALTKLFQKFREIYKLSDAHQDFLAEQIATIGHSCAPFPVVFQHGDPGTWNLRVLETGGIAFIDWEAGEPQGIPLWDLFYFMRTYGSWVSRTKGSRDTLENFAQHFLTPSALGALLIEATERYCSRVGLERNLIEPLFYTCWMHRALKESTRLTVASLESGHYVNLLRLCIERRNAPALESLFFLRQDASSE